MSEYHNTRAQEILATIRYATIATVTPDGKPWNSPVAHEIDADNIIYWFSDKANQHSVNVRENPHAYIVIYDSTVPEGDGEGVYIEVDVTELDNADEINAIRNTKKGKVVDDASEFLGDAVRRCYKAVPKRMWMNDAEVEDGKFIRDYRVEVNFD